MKKAVVTLLGMINHTKPDYIIVDGKIKKVLINVLEKDRAVYRFSKELNKFSEKLIKERYINTLPLLIDVFPDRDVIPIATEKAKKNQKETLDFLNIKSSALDNTKL